MRTTMIPSLVALAGLTLLGMSAVAEADTITCPSPLGSYDRQFTLGPTATACEYGTGNPLASDILADYPATPWSKVGDVNAGNGNSNGYLTITLTSGAWGSQNAAGTWSISPDFWFNFGEAVISIHSGNGGGEPDYAAFSIVPGSLSGTWAYALFTGSGGGLSNLGLWGRGPAHCTSPTQPGCSPPDQNVPEPATLALLGIGLWGVGLSRRRRA